MTDCPICLCGHNPEIHAATKRVHRWLRKRISNYLAPVKTHKPLTPAQRAAVALGRSGKRVVHPEARASHA